MKSNIRLQNDRARALWLNEPKNYMAQWKNFLRAEVVIREAVEKTANAIRATGPVMGYQLIAPDYFSVSFGRQIRRRKDYVVRSWITDAAKFADSPKRRLVQIYRLGQCVMIQLDDIVIDPDTNPAPLES